MGDGTQVSSMAPMSSISTPAARSQRHAGSTGLADGGRLIHADESDQDLRIAPVTSRVPGASVPN